MQASPHSRIHQGMVTGMKFNQVNTVPKTVMTMKLWGMHIGETRMGLHLGCTQDLSQLAQLCNIQVRRIEFQGSQQWMIPLQQVVINQSRGLVQHIVGGLHTTPLHDPACRSLQTSLTNCLPKFLPLSKPKKASGADSIP